MGSPVLRFVFVKVILRRRQSLNPSGERKTTQKPNPPTWALPAARRVRLPAAPAAPPSVAGWNEIKTPLLSLTPTQASAAPASGLPSAISCPWSLRPETRRRSPGKPPARTARSRPAPRGHGRGLLRSYCE
ncbi:translation initiation factor IF-2-like isoform X2 [Mustela erminea]|uniref:translation initiation factor IF-2-like isoform X2 n=1 Tax=Mustela erminea TaxID=36723 RepID=UPI0013874860|nr:translation initiation factor IF-2-like isoform X2 [Mustela erminea]XP_032200275.1 translation initiation factor IF-2-like isoform X2 [Mustela erminea]XP_032200276.1 translation initiation factor IF-2-like isoform X2 [Mustela erminea]XP_032200277.1 translation initiation factor IF-2-like isoform X2 [Mustela erminea]